MYGKVKPFILLFIITGGLLFGQKDQGHTLKLDSGAHMGIIRQLLVSSDGRYIVTCSDDKSIRIWNSHTLEEERKILGEIGSENAGKVFAIALSPDDRYLAAAGFMTGTSGHLRIYDFKSGRLLKVLAGHKDVVNSLAFSPDGRYLVSGSWDSSVKVWDSRSDFRLIESFEEHKDGVFGVEVFKSDLDYTIASISYDQRLNLYSLRKKGLIESYRHDKKISYLAVSDEYIAITSPSDRNIYILNRRLNLVKTIETKESPTALKFSPSGRYLAVGSDKYPEVCMVYDMTDRFRPVSSFNKHNNYVIAINFLNDDTVISAGGENYDIYLWNALDGHEKGHIAGKGGTIWTLGLNAEGVAFKTHWEVKDHKYEKALRFNDFSITDIVDEKSYSQANSNYKEYSLQTAKGGEFGYTNGLLQIKRDGKVVAEIERKSSDGYRHNVYSFSNNGLIISGGTNGALHGYNLDGTKIAAFTGHTGELLTIALFDNVLASAGDDQTIRLWNLDDVKEAKQELVDYSWFSDEWKKWVAGKYPELNLKRKRDIQRLFDNLMRDYGPKEANKLLVGKGLTEVKPFLNIFISTDDEWVAWSESGYYNSSVGGDNYIGFHINQGGDRAALYYSSERFYSTYYRPEVIRNILELKNEREALKISGKEREIEEVELEKILPPVIELVSPVSLEFTTKAEKIELEFNVIKQSDHEISEVVILLNGRPVDTRGLKKSTKEKKGLNVKTTIQLEEKSNILTVMAKNKYASSNSVVIKIEREVVEEMENLYKPDLYILAIGVSNYKNSDFNLEFADKDAESIVELMSKQSGQIYRSVKSRLLTNEKATREEILDSIDWLDREVTQRDVAILFIAGHGVNDDRGNYYFLNYEAEPEALRKTAVKWIDFEDVVTNLAGKVILLADTCHSGNIMGSTRRSIDMTQAIKSILSAGTGQIIMTATTGNSYSYEDEDWGHGAFTLAFLDAIKKGQADYDKDGVITIKEIDLFVTTRVKELTGGKQKPTTIIPASLTDFAVSTVE